MDGNVVSGQTSTVEANPLAQVVQPNQSLPVKPEPGQQPKEPTGTQFDEALYRKIAREEAAKVAQSFTDKASNRIQQMVSEQIQALEMNRGILNLSEEQVEAAKQKIVMNAMTAKPQGAETGAQHGPTEPANPEPQLHPIVAEALGLMEDAQLQVEEGDPEFEKYFKPHFSKATVDRTFLLDVARAIDAKQARLIQQRENAAVRTPGGAGSGGPTNSKPLTAEEKISQGLKRPWSSTGPS